jgi:hypothetical protein
MFSLFFYKKEKTQIPHFPLNPKFPTLSQPRKFIKKISAARKGEGYLSLNKNILKTFSQPRKIS